MILVGTTKTPPTRIFFRIPSAILFIARWLEDMLPVSHSNAKRRSPSERVASTRPGFFTVAMSSLVSKPQPREYRYCTQACLIGFTPFPLPDRKCVVSGEGGESELLCG